MFNLELFLVQYTIVLNIPKLYMELSSELSIEKAHKNKYETRQRKHLAMLEVIFIYFSIDFIRNK
jgi:hypothetical protein